MEIANKDLKNSVDALKKELELECDSNKTYPRKYESYILVEVAEWQCQCTIGAPHTTSINT